MEPVDRDLPQPGGAAQQRDLDVVALLRRGEHAAAFERLVERYEGKVYRLCVAMLREPALAQDAAQESLLRVWRGLERWEEGRAALSTWIYAITRNRCLTAIEASAGRPRELSLADEAVQAEAETLAAPDAQAVAERAQTLRRLVDALPEPVRRVLTLYYFEERSVAEVALMLEQPEATVKTQLFRARATLQRRLAALGLDDPARWAA